MRGSIVSEEIVKEDEKEEPIVPIEVSIKKEETKPESNFDYDDYLPTDDEIHETEKEIHENEMKRKVSNA